MAESAMYQAPADGPRQVTVTGAPKTWAMRFVENNEKSNRHWCAAGRGHASLLTDLDTWHCKLCTDTCCSPIHY